MNTLVDILNSKGYIFSKLINIPLKSLNSRKKVEIFLGVDLKSNYISVVKRDSTKRLLMKEINELDELVDRVQILRDHKILKRVLITESDICSKVEDFSKTIGWRIVRVAM